MPGDKIRWTPYGFDGRVAGIGPSTIASDCSNFLFENGRATNRPGLIASTTITGLAAGTAVYKAESLRSSFIYQNYLVTAQNFLNPHVYYAPSNWALVEILPPGGRVFSYASDLVGFLGNLYITSPAVGGGIFTSGGGAAVSVNTQRYQFITTHLTRVVAGFPQDRLLGWCVSGNGNDWASPGSGTHTFADVEDAMAGLYTIRNQLVILFANSIAMGYPTGVSSPAFRFETIASELDPVLCGQCVYGEKVLWVSKGGVHEFNGNSISDIGDQVIGDILFYNESRGATWDGFVSTGAGENTTTEPARSPRMRYHLVPKSSFGLSMAGVPAYIYDFKEQVWSKHLYGSTQWSHAFNERTLNDRGRPFFFNLAGPSIPFRWNETTACEEPAFLQSPSLLIGQEEVDYAVDRIMLLYRNRASCAVTVILSGMLNKELKSWTDSITLGTASDNKRTMRDWIKRRLETSNVVDMRITAAAGSKADITFASIFYNEAGEYRGE